MTTSPTKSVVFITGTFLGNNCWDKWMNYFENNGYKCIAPAWPHKNASPEVLRNRHPDPAIASNRLESLTDYFEQIIKTLPEKPILIGHSFGGLIVQLLLQGGQAAAGVAVHSLPPLSTIAIKVSLLKTWWEGMGFFTSTGKTYMLSFRKWKSAIDNQMSCDKQKESFYKYAIPESKLIIRDAFKCNAKINFKNPHSPLLFTSGGYDQLIPAAVNFRNYTNYNPGRSITEYKNFQYHNHLVFDHLAWKEEAEFILHWLQQLK
jgi:pimeloyl-ACP methyl ester carboxylesterase